MALPFDGKLNPNTVYKALFNMVLQQRQFDLKTATPRLADMLRVGGSMYGDTLLYYSMDIGESYDFEGDSEAEKLLNINRNNTQVVQSIVIDKARQTNITIDYFLTKQAWFTETAFIDFTNQLIMQLTNVKRVYDNGTVNTFVGTQESTAEKGVIFIPAPAGQTEADNRLFSQRVAENYANLAVDMADNTRAYNELSFLQAMDLKEMVVVWNAEVYNKILKIDLPTIFHNDELKPKATIVLPSRYFGTVNAGTATGNTATRQTKGEKTPRTVPGAGVNGAVRSLIEQTIGEGENAIHYYPGDAIADGVVAPDGTTYTEDSQTIICKIFPVEAIPFMTAFVAATNFWNARSLTENEYLTWMHNTLERLAYLPFITIKADGAINTAKASKPLTDKQVDKLNKQIALLMEEIEQLKAEKEEANVAN